MVRIQKDFSLASHLSEKEERSSWNQENTFPDDSILDRYLASRAFCTLGTSSWPLVFDPYDKLEKYLKASKSEYQNKTSKKMCRAKTSSLVPVYSGYSLADQTNLRCNCCGMAFFGVWLLWPYYIGLTQAFKDVL